MMGVWSIDGGQYSCTTGTKLFQIIRWIILMIGMGPILCEGHRVTSSDLPHGWLPVSTIYFMEDVERAPLVLYMVWMSKKILIWGQPDHLRSSYSRVEQLFQFRSSIPTARVLRYHSLSEEKDTAMSITHANFYSIRVVNPWNNFSERVIRFLCSIVSHTHHSLTPVVSVTIVT